MRSYTEIKKYIKFLLSDLTSQNDHHKFETMMRHFSRQLIGINILPATGPVSKGGDQGRDFETFKTQKIEDFENGLSINKSIAFGCTLQKENIASKIKTDVTSIITQGTQLDEIYYFISNDLVVSDRHKIQKWVLETYSLTINIFDGEAISEQLSTKNLFWIAQEFLNISSELYEPIDDLEYEKIKNKWKDKIPTRANYAEFIEIKTASRKALFNDSARHDLLFWVTILENYSKLDGNIQLRRKALYEAIAIYIRGTRKLEEKENLVTTYFSQGDFNNIGELEDAFVVFSYSFTSSKLKTSNFKTDDLDKWRKNIESYLDSCIIQKNSVNELAIAYSLKARMVFFNANQQSINEAFGWWAKLAELIESTPLFPLEQLMELLKILIPVIGSDSRYEILTEKLDSVLKLRLGGFAAAEYCRDRAIQFYENGQILKAINEAHKAKIDWFASETLEGSLLTMLLISGWYFELGLTFASKYYALSVAFVGIRSDVEEIKLFVPRGLAQVVKCEYAQGDWISFMNKCELLFGTLAIYSPTLENQILADIYFENIYYLSNIIALTTHFSPELGVEINNKWLAWNVKEGDTKIIIPKLIDMWSKLSEEDIKNKLIQELNGPPTIRFETKQHVTWKQLGITWIIEWENSYSNTSKAQQFIATLQIILADLINIDLYLLPVQSKVELRFCDIDDYSIEELHTNEYYSWLIELSDHNFEKSGDLHEYNRITFSLAFSFISQISLLRSDVFQNIVTKAMEKGVVGKTFFVNSYEMMFQEITSSSIYKESEAKADIAWDSFEFNKLDFTEPVHIELQWKHSLIQEYDADKVKQIIKDRYSNSLKTTHLTIKRLNVSSDFKTVVQELKSNGWKDWHITMAIASISVNFRIQQKNKINSPELAMKLLRLELDQEENENSTIVPLELFNLDNLKRNLFMSMSSTIKGLGLNVNMYAPNHSGIEKFLSIRYNYWQDDIVHEPIFA